MDNEKRETVTVFWDYENCPCPMSAKVSGLIKEIKTTIDETLGRTLSKRINLYAPMTRVHDKTRGDLIDCGVILMDVATKRKQESVDKRIIADIGLWAADLAFARELGIVALISGDSDFGYILSQLRDRSYISKILLFTGPKTKGSLTIHADYVFRLFFPLSSRENPFSYENQDLIEKPEYIRARTDEEYHHQSSRNNYYGKSNNSYNNSSYYYGSSSKNRSHYHSQQRGYSNAGHGHQSHGPARRTHIDMIKGENINSRSHSPSHGERAHGNGTVSSYAKTPNLVSNSATNLIEMENKTNQNRRVGGSGGSGRDRSERGGGGSGGQHTRMREIGSTGSSKKHKLASGNNSHNKSKTRRIKIKKRGEIKPNLIEKALSPSLKNNKEKSINLTSLSDPGNDDNSNIDATNKINNKESNDANNVVVVGGGGASSSSTSSQSGSGSGTSSGTVSSKGSNKGNDDGLSLSSGGGGASPLQLLTSIPAVPPKTLNAADVEQQLKEQQKLKLKAQQSRHDHEFSVKLKSNDYYGIGSNGATVGKMYPYLTQNNSKNVGVVAYSDQPHLKTQIYNTQPVLNNNNNVEVRKQETNNTSNNNNGSNVETAAKGGSYLSYFNNKKSSSSNNSSGSVGTSAAASSNGGNSSIPSYMLYSMQTKDVNSNSANKQVNNNNNSSVKPLVSSPTKNVNIGELSSSTQRSLVNTESPSPKKINFEDDNGEVSVPAAAVTAAAAVQNGVNSENHKGRKALTNEFFMTLIKPKNLEMSPIFGSKAAPNDNGGTATTPVLSGIRKVSSDKSDLGSSDSSQSNTNTNDSIPSASDADRETQQLQQLQQEQSSNTQIQVQTMPQGVHVTQVIQQSQQQQQQYYQQQQRSNSNSNYSRRGHSSGHHGHFRRSPSYKNLNLSREEECRLARLRTDTVVALFKEMTKPGHKFEIAKSRLITELRKKFQEIEMNEPGLINSESSEWINESITIAIQTGKIEERNIGYCSLPDLLPTVLACTKRALNYSGGSGGDSSGNDSGFYNNSEGKPMTIRVKFLVDCMLKHYSQYYYENETRNIINVLKTAKSLFNVDRNSLKKCVDGGYQRQDMLNVKFWVRKHRRG